MLESIEQGSVTRELALEQLARRLHWKMEYLSPSDTPEWDNLTEYNRAFYRSCVGALFEEIELSRAALK
jgi:hypothetical protein